MMLVAGLPAGEFTVADEEREQVLQAKRATIGQLPAATYPYVRESVDALMGCADVEGYFGYGTTYPWPEWWRCTRKTR